MTDPLLVFDPLLAVAIVGIAGLTLLARDPFAMIVAFAVFGIFVAIGFVRLMAPDVARAEAVIGTGVTGGAMAQRGVVHPVTAVLLNFRSSDTLIEVVVLLASVIIVWQIDRGLPDGSAPIPGEICQRFARVILPVGDVTRGYLLWIGATGPSGAVLSGAMIKAGLYRIIVAVPLGRAAYADPGVVMMSAGLVTIFTALLLAAREPSPKAVLGFSSVSQMGIMALGIGVSLSVPEAWAVILPVLVFLAAHHALAKGALFLGTGAFAAQDGRIGAVVMTAALLLPVLILSGLPTFSGALGKEALKSALYEGPAGWVSWLTLALSLSGVVTTLIMARFLVQVWRARPAALAWVTVDAVVLPFVALILGSVALPLLWPALAGSDALPITEAAPGQCLADPRGVLDRVGRCYRCPPASRRLGRVPGCARGTDGPGRGTDERDTGAAAPGHGATRACGPGGG
ncbi:hydrogenase subunit MbhD domain-containing protein [Roseovarius sp. D22-M7]|uniref:hydrogenase subunit MbhD domain-containing protein n=1 Tax=Roseovarius sp. D22-M7 TaxID=3127116 RepID=UPI00300F999D